MNADLQEQIASLIEAAKRAGSDSATFIQAQAPDVVAQLVRWKIAEGALTAIGGAILLFVAFKIYQGICNWMKGRDWTDHPELMLPVLFLFCPSLIGGAVLFSNGLLQSAEAIVAPKIVILETISSLVKK